VLRTTIDFDNTMSAVLRTASHARHATRAVLYQTYTGGVMEISREDFEELRTLYEKARNEGRNTVQFKSQTLLTDYAKYLIEYLSTIYANDESV